MDDKDQVTPGTTAVLEKPAPDPQPASSGNMVPPTIPTAVGNMEQGDEPKNPMPGIPYTPSTAISEN